MGAWRVKERNKLDSRASADSIKYHGMYENEYGGYRSESRYRNTCILDLNLKGLS
jgi:hypothetical protein